MNQNTSQRQIVFMNKNHPYYNAQHRHQPHEPQFMQHNNYYGLNSPRSNEKKTLIDHIINKCQSPKVVMNKCPLPKQPLNHYQSLKVGDNKENSIGQGFGSTEYHNFSRNIRRNSNESRASKNSNRSSVESDRRTHRNLQSSNTSTLRPTSNIVESQYYKRKSLKTQNPHSIANCSKPPICRPISNLQTQSVSPRKNIAIPLTPGFYKSNVPSSLTQKADKIRKDIENERNEHLEHCRNEERKLRLYYVELENKLCEARTRELQVLAEYQATKLEELDNCHKKLENDSSEKECEKELTRLRSEFVVRVSDGSKPQIQGCLVTGVSGVLFSFDQQASSTLQ